MIEKKWEKAGISKQPASCSALTSCTFKNISECDKQIQEFKSRQILDQALIDSDH